MDKKMIHIFFLLVSFSTTCLSQNNMIDSFLGQLGFCRDSVEVTQMKVFDSPVKKGLGYAVLSIFSLKDSLYFDEYIDALVKVSRPCLIEFEKESYRIVRSGLINHTVYNYYAPPPWGHPSFNLDSSVFNISPYTYALSLTIRNSTRNYDFSRYEYQVLMVPNEKGFSEVFTMLKDHYRIYHYSECKKYSEEIKKEIEVVVNQLVDGYYPIRISSKYETFMGNFDCLQGTNVSRKETDEWTFKEGRYLYFSNIGPKAKKPWDENLEFENRADKALSEN